MNKEEIEKAIKILLKEDRFYDDETEIKATKVLLKYIKELEQKESILDKVTDKLKDDIEKDYCIKEIIGDSYITVGVKEYSVKPYAREILNIIEGGRNGN